MVDSPDSTSAARQNRILPQTFYQRNTVTVARALLGCILVHEIHGRRLAGRIVETEAYLQTDPAAHSFRGPTTRNAVMFGPAGRVYLFFTYGLHWCLNVVTREAGTGEAVLIRALEPLAGQEVMLQNRPNVQISQLMNGPAKITQAMGITPRLQGHTLDQPPLYIERGDRISGIVSTGRIGLSRSQEVPHRFYIRGNLFVSHQPVDN